ncbi:Aspartic proteinase-like protein 1 [Abeliophyllum distichum]|uniref:Aspartic proteinase-like protein 1 n=1 Tax=Abeliophyllum distichum TaxID=126358 RepID=A0ABD1Q0A4_9LAMI
MRLLLGGDLKRQRLRLGTQNQLLVPSQGGQTYNYGNDLGWLHYTWIDMGTPNTSFLVALDAGSDLFWVPCDCIQCAPLSLSYYYMLHPFGVVTDTPSESAAKGTSWRDLYDPGVKHALVVGVGLQIFQLI